LCIWICLYAPLFYLPFILVDWSTILWDIGENCSSFGGCNIFTIWQVQFLIWIWSNFLYLLLLIHVGFASVKFGFLQCYSSAQPYHKLCIVFLHYSSSAQPYQKLCAVFLHYSSSSFIVVAVSYVILNCQQAEKYCIDHEYKLYK